MTSEPKSAGSAEAAPAGRPIGFVDSGIGGLPYLARARDLLPGERFAYLADRENFPYGARPREEVKRLVINAVSRLVRSFQPKLAVIACNTASVVSLSELRDHFSIPFVGVVPAIKPAGAASPEGRIAVLATERTVEDPYVSDLAQAFAPRSTLLPIAAGELVSFIESRLALATDDDILQALRSSVVQLRENEADVVVLACTHFLHVRDQLARLLGPDLPILDSVEGVARQIARVCGETGTQVTRPTDDSGLLRDTLMVTGGEPGENYRLLADRFRLELVTAPEGAS